MVGRRTITDSDISARFRPRQVPGHPGLPQRWPMRGAGLRARDPRLAPRIRGDGARARGFKVLKSSPPGGPARAWPTRRADATELKFCRRRIEAESGRLSGCRTCRRRGGWVGPRAPCGCRFCAHHGLARARPHCAPDVQPAQGLRRVPAVSHACRQRGGDRVWPPASAASSRSHRGSRAVRTCCEGLAGCLLGLVHSDAARARTRWVGSESHSRI